MPREQTPGQAQPNAVRLPLTRDRVLLAAIAIADESGIDSVTMRRLGQSLGVEAMSLYHHVANKDDVLDGMVDVLVSMIERPPEDSEWRASIRERSRSARRLLKQHPWAPRLIATRTHLSGTLLGHMDAVVGDLLRGGLSKQLAHHGMHVLGSRILGFTQELFDPTDLGPGVADIAAGRATSGDYASLASVLKDITHDDDVEFEFALDLILDGIARAAGTI